MKLKAVILVHTVEYSMTRVQLDGGLNSLTSSISFSFSTSRSLSLGGGSIKKFEELSLGSSNLRSINNRGRGDSGIDRGNRKNTRVDRSNRQVVSSHTETKVISNIVDSVDSSLILVSVRSSNSTISITLLLLGTVDVIVTISNVAKFILGLELGAYWASNRSSMNSSHRSSSISSYRCSVSRGVCSSGDSRGSSVSSNGSRSSSMGKGTISNRGIGTISTSIWHSRSIHSSSIVKTSSSKILRSNRKLSLSSTCSQKSGDNSEKLHDKTVRVLLNGVPC